MHWFPKRTSIMLITLTLAMTLISALLVWLEPRPAAPPTRVPDIESPAVPEDVVLKPQPARGPANGTRS